MIYFKPQNGFKTIFRTLNLLAVLLIPSFFILISSKAGINIWLSLLGLIILIISITKFIALKTTKYWIENETFHYKSTFIKGTIDIQSIRKLEVNTTCLLNNQPATSNFNGIMIYFNKYEDTFITPEDNQGLVESLTMINPNIDVRNIK